MSGTPEPEPKSIQIAEKRRVSMCVGCGSQISDQFILRVAPDLEWHAACLKCADCNQHLDESCTCYVREGKTYCKRDYVRIFGTKCTKCKGGFSRSDFVMRARNNIYHIDCFRCVACSRQLIPGDEFALRDDGLFCKSDHDVLVRASGPTAIVNGNSSENNNNNVNNNNNNNETKPNLQQLAGRKKCSVGSTASTQSQTSRSGRSNKQEQKTNRVRTVLNEKQLHTLRTCYMANPRPDALMKEQLTEMTNLSPRVIRVWFQNKRCKDKKRQILVQQMHEQAKNGGSMRPLQGVPMVASSPVRHESPMSHQNPVEVQSYQAPWKALTDFAMQSEIDQPPFQQLMNAFDNGDPYGSGSSPCSMMGYGGYDDFSHPTNSVSHSPDIPETPSDMASPISQ